MLVGEELLGETECSFAIPKESQLIQDGKIEFTFCLPDGREKQRVVDLHGLKASNPVAEIVAAPFVLAGFGLISLGHDGEDQDSFSPAYQSEEQEKAAGRRAVSTLAGLGVLAIGAGLHSLLGGDGDSLTAHPIFVDFNEPPGGGDPQVSPASHEEEPAREGMQSLQRL